MLIASIIHPKRSPRRRVELFGILYEFLPKTDKAGQTHYVADVSAEAAACLLERDNYYKFGHGQPA
ncbi:MAG: hypothetical protein L0H70_08560, partial [Xanthomonadales bacterium]|nr:hypothetical protein [Xanthomonadales bacterium]